MQIRQSPLMCNQQHSSYRNKCDRESCNKPLVYVQCLWEVAETANPPNKANNVKIDRRKKNTTETRSNIYKRPYIPRSDCVEASIPESVGFSRFSSVLHIFSHRETTLIGSVKNPHNAFPSQSSTCNVAPFLVAVGVVFRSVTC